MPERIFLFDLDGVLIQPGGYRAAVRATLKYFAERLGVGPQLLDEETISIFESQGITSEWDMVPISLAILLDQIAACSADLPRWDTIDAAILEAAGNAIHIERVDFAATIRKLPFYLAPPLAPSDAILRTIQQSGRNELFPHLQGEEILQDLFGRTRELTRCATSVVFQNYILGDRLFTETYGTRALFYGESYLDQFDRVEMSDEWRIRILREVQANFIKAAAITARPSLPPVKLTGGMNGYSPEAEQALRLAGLSGIPFIGYGSIQYLAQQLQQSPENLLKPSPVQALAALRVAMGDETWPALVEAAKLAGISTDGLNAVHSDPQADHFRVGSEFSIHIFEDSPIGIQATQGAAEILKKSGLNIRQYAWGITQNEDKKAALQQLGARVYRDINQALDAAFEIEKKL